MTTKILKSILLVGLTVALFSFDLPKGWFKAGSDPKKYEMSIDKNVGQDGKDVATIKSIEKKIDGFGTLMQNCSPEKYAGKRVRMSAYMKSKDVAKSAGFWFRVDQKNSDQPSAFDNMDGRSIKGTTEWKKYDIVLDVSADASNLAYGALIVGTGQIWIDNITFEIVDNSVPSTNMFKDKGQTPKEQSPKSPTNLNFDE